MNGLIIKSTGSWYRVRLENLTEVEARLRGKNKLLDSKTTNPIAVGDIVNLQKVDNDYIIENILPRKNYVIRVSPRKKGHNHIIASNIDQGILIASFKEPRTSLGFIDRFLVSLESYGIGAKIIFNKSDLYDEAEMEKVKNICDSYEKIGYPTLITSFLGSNLSVINDWIQNKTSLLFGHSGTGKSTLINFLIPNINQKIGNISSFANKGMHTTTFAQIFSLNTNTHLIDTPGVKELGLSSIEPWELSHFFPEMAVFIGKCKFHNCLHVNEIGCKVKEEYHKGNIQEFRYKNYLGMLENDDNRK